MILIFDSFAHICKTFWLFPCLAFFHLWLFSILPSELFPKFMIFHFFYYPLSSPTSSVRPWDWKYPLGLHRLITWRGNKKNKIWIPWKPSFVNQCISLWNVLSPWLWSKSLWTAWLVSTFSRERVCSHSLLCSFSVESLLHMVSSFIAYSYSTEQSEFDQFQELPEAISRCLPSCVPAGCDASVSEKTVHNKGAVKLARKKCSRRWIYMSYCLLWIMYYLFRADIFLCYAKCFQKK